MSDAEFCGGRRRRRGGGGFWNPTGLFTGGEQGAWYDPSDLTTLFQDTAGTTAVTAVEQPVSLMLDKRLGGLNALGPELVTNGDFSNGTTGWTVGDWVVASGTATASSTSTSLRGGGVTPTQGKFYQIRFTVVSYTSGTLAVTIGGNFTTNVNLTGAAMTPGAKSVIVAAGSSPVRGVEFYGGTISATITNISVREVPGNHAYTPSSASTSRPVLSARVNLLAGTESIGGASWTLLNTSVSDTTGIAPNGTATADTLLASAGTNAKYVAQVIATLAGQVTFSVYARAGTHSFLQLVHTGDAEAYATFDLTTGATGSAGTKTTASIANVGGGWYWCVATFASTTTYGTGYRLYIAPSASATYAQTLVGAGTESVILWGADVRLTNDGVGLPVYQRVTTSTDYDTTGFPLYLRADGSDDYMLTSSIDFSATDKMTVVAGVRKLSDALAGVVTELSVARSTNVGSFTLFTSASSAANYSYLQRGSTDVTSSTPAATFTAPITNILSGYGNIATDEINLRVNGVNFVISTSDQGTGNFGNYPLYLFRRGGTSVPFNGRFYGLVVRGAATDTATLQQTEAFLNGKTRAY